jgi:hypothetical protein
MPALRRSTALAVFLAAAPGAVALAQAPPRSADSPCYHARPKPACSVFFLTNAGVYIQSPRGGGGTPLRGMVDWGVMANVSPRHAIGASWFVTLDQDDFTTGPVLRYRRWFEHNRSLDITLGTPVAASQLKSGSLLGAVKYNPVHWVSFGVRPEYLRYSDYICGPANCAQSLRTSVRVAAGAEIGWAPGLVLSLGGGVVLGLLVLALAGVD